jgi:hypothetical protein
MIHTPRATGAEHLVDANAEDERGDLDLRPLEPAGEQRPGAAPSQRLSRLLPKRRCWHRRRRGGGAMAWEEERVEVKARVGGGAVEVAE